MMEFRSWRMPPEYDPIMVFSALNTLTQQWDCEAAQLVVNAFAALPLTPVSEMQVDLCLTSEQTTSIIVADADRNLFRFDTTERYVVTDVDAPPAFATGYCGSFVVHNVFAEYDDGKPAEAMAGIYFRIPVRDPEILRGNLPMPPIHVLDYNRLSLIPRGLYRNELRPGTPPLRLRIKDWIRTHVPLFSVPMLRIWYNPTQVVIHKTTPEDMEVFEAMHE